MKHEDVVKRLRTDPEFVVAEIALLEADVAKWKALARELVAALRQVAYGYAPHPDGRTLHAVVSDVLDKARAAGLLEGK